MESPMRDITGWRDHVVLRRSGRARRVRLKIHPGGQVELVVPAGFDERHIPTVLDQSESWVLRNLRKVSSLAPSRPAEAPGLIRLEAIGEEWMVRYLSGDGGRYGCRSAGEAELQVSGGEFWQKSLKRWLARKGKQHLVPWLKAVSDEVGIAYADAAIRGQRTRWGSCSSRRCINLNYGLLFLPPELVRYLFIHELCHTRHMNHSASYWRLVESMEPDYRQLDRALRRAGGHVPAWLHARDIVAV